MEEWRLNFVPSLNSLRFFGALFVILLHINSYLWFESLGIEKLHILISGSTGVVLFYVLSGFLLTSLAIREIERTGQFSFRRFFIRRALRLFPLYFLALFVLFVVDQLGLTQIGKTSWIYALAYSYNFVPEADYNGLLGSLHTLGTEEHFYLFFALLFSLAVSVSKRRAVVIVGSVFLFALLTVDLLWPVFAPYDDVYFVGRWTWFAIKPILIGCLGAIVYSYLKSNAAKQIPGFLSGRVLLNLFMALYLKQIFGYSEVQLSLGFLFLIVYLVEFPQSRISNALSNRVLVYLGTISYGLYVWQSVLNGTGATHRWIESPYISTSLVFVAAMVSYRYYETPFLKLKERGFSSRNAS